MPPIIIIINEQTSEKPYNKPWWDTTLKNLRGN